MSFSDPVVVDLTEDSSSEGSSGSSHPQVLKESTAVTACPQLLEDSPPVKFLRPSDSLAQLPSTTAATHTISAPSSSEAQFTCPFGTSLPTCLLCSNSAVYFINLSQGHSAVYVERHIDRGHSLVYLHQC